MRILLICMGNICRSPMAEGLLRHKLKATGLLGTVQLDSAGTGGWHSGMPPDPRAVRVCGEHGIRIEDLRARQIVAEDFLRSDLVLCADRRNLAHLQALAPHPAGSRIALLLSWSGIERPAEVPDPYDGGIEDFRSVFRLLDRATDTILTKLQLPA
jgi:protein-tyrosine phosphatase